MSKRYLWIPVALLVPALWALTPAALDYAPGTPVALLPAPQLIPGTEERVVPADPPSDWVVVVLHGFSATRQESAPLGELVATSLGASLVEARLAGHGLAENPMLDVRAEHWMADAERVLGIADGLGGRIVVIGSSTGATLAAAMLDQPLAKKIHTLVMLSPNFMPRGAGAAWLTRPGGPLLARLIAGETRCWEPAVVLPDAIVAAYDAFATPRKVLVEVTDSGDRKDHILAGDIMSPGTTQPIADRIVEFTRHQAP